MLRGKSLVENLMRENSFKGLFGARKDEDAYEDTDAVSSGQGSPSAGFSKKWVRELSSLANTVLARCARILLLPIEELQDQFDNEISVLPNVPSKYARNFVEYFCFSALAVSTRALDYLSDKEFRQLTFDMMLAWETPGAADKPVIKVDTERTVGREAFVRLGPAIAGVADHVTVHSQFDTLTAASNGRLQFSSYDKYLVELDRMIKTIKSQSSLAHLSKFQMVKAEIVVELEGTVTTQPVLQHVGVSIWPGRLTLTDHALYFEPLGVVSYDKAKKFDLAGNFGQVVKPDLTGPWGARLFDKAISCKSSAIPEPLIFEFPEFTGHARRDYWLTIVRELIFAHQCSRKYFLDEKGSAEVLSKAVLAIARLKAIREVHHCLPDKPESLLTFLTCEEIPGGDLIMEAVARSLQTGIDVSNERNGFSKRSRLYAKSAVATIAILSGSNPKKDVALDNMGLPVGEFLIGDLNPVEKAVLQSRDSSKRVELAKSTIDGVKVDGIEVNMAVLKELIMPLSAVIEWIKSLQSWNEPFKTFSFLIICSYLLFKNLVGYILPACLLCLAGFMLWFRQGQDSSSGEVRVISPASQNTVEQLLALQEGLTALKDLLQAGNIFLLKLRAVLFSTLPQATDHVVVVLVVLSLCITILPWKLIAIVIFWEAFTRQTRFRQESTERVFRRVREWWYSIPVVPVRLLKLDEDKKKS